MNPLTMPSDLRTAHDANDRAVLAVYGLSANASESEVVAHLFNLYVKAVEAGRQIQS